MKNEYPLSWTQVFWATQFRMHGNRIDEVRLNLDVLPNILVVHGDCCLLSIKKIEHQFELEWQNRANLKDKICLSRAEVLAMFDIREDGNDELEQILEIGNCISGICCIHAKACRHGEGLIIINTQSKNPDDQMYLYVNQDLKNKIRKK